ncbi:MAG: DoxX family protein [Gammaproteobacteria bacterium]|nr:DoxX family protein [Gammaproteobacteria bacterium]
MFDVLDSLKPHAHWLLRIGLASVFLFHGIGKVMDLGGFSQMTGLPTAVAALVALAELAGGVGIIVGAFTNDLITRLAGLAITPVMLGAISMVHWGRWDFSAAEGFPMGGMEFQVVLLLTAIYFLVMGNAGSSRTS